MPVCSHPVSHLHMQSKNRLHLDGIDYQLFCDVCGKTVLLELKDVFHWLKLLELRDAQAEVKSQQQLATTDPAVFIDPMEGI